MGTSEQPSPGWGQPGLSYTRNTRRHLMTSRVPREGSQARPFSLTLHDLFPLCCTLTSFPRKSEPVALCLHPWVGNSFDLTDSNPRFPGSEPSLQEKTARFKGFLFFLPFFCSRYTIVFIYYAFCLVLMMLLRPLLVKKVACGLGKSDRFKSIYAALYFFPILTVLQAVGGGLLCESPAADTLTNGLWEGEECDAPFGLRIRVLFKVMVRSLT